MLAPSFRRHGSRTGALLQAAGSAVAALLTIAAPAAVEPAPPAADLDRVVAHLDADDFQEALRASSRLAAEFPGSAEALALHGLAMLRSGEIQAASKLLARAQEIDSGCPEARLGLGRLAFGRNRMEEAEALLLGATSGGRLRGEAWAALRRTRFAAGWIEGALDAARTAAATGGPGAAARDPGLSSTIAFLESIGESRVLRTPEGFRGTTLHILAPAGEPRRLLMVPVHLDGKGPFPFHIDSALGGNLTLSPKVADALGLERYGNYEAAGVGAASRTTQSAFVRHVRLGDLVVEGVPVMVLDSPTFHGEAEGILGTGLLRRFDCVLDAAAGTLEILPHGAAREGSPDPARVAVRAPLFVEGGPVVPVSMGRGRPKPFIVDTAASVTLIDDGYFERNVRPSMAPGDLVKIQVQGMGGVEDALMMPSASVFIEGRSFDDLRIVVLDLERISRIARRYTDGILGTDLLLRYRIHLRFSVPELILESTEPPAGG